MARDQSNARTVAECDQHVDQRRKSRRQIARTSFIVSVALGALIIVLGLLDGDVAKRVADMGGFLSMYFGGLYGIVLGYFGVGSYENVNATSRGVDRPGGGSR